LGKRTRIRKECEGKKKGYTKGMKDGSEKEKEQEG
jgi:hypothetical protein